MGDIKCLTVRYVSVECKLQSQRATRPDDKRVKGQGVASGYVCIIPSFMNGQLDNCLSGWPSWKCRIDNHSSNKKKKVSVYWIEKDKNMDFMFTVC